MTPGILPVSNVAQTRKFAAMCGASIPAWLDRLFEGLDDLPAARQLVAATRRRRALRAALCGRRAAIPLLHAQPGRAQLRHLPPARPQAEGTRPVNTAEQLRAAAAQAHPRQGRRLRHADPGAPARARPIIAAASASARDQKGNNDLLNLTRPDVVRGIAQSFADAGADILATNTFNANRISQADYGAEALVREINVASARIIREVGRRATASSAGSRARSGRPTRRCRSRPTSTIPAIARSISTSSPTSMSSRSRRWSKAASTSS